MHKWGILFATIAALSVVVFMTVFGIKLFERPVPVVAEETGGSSLEEKRLDLEAKRLEVEELRLRAQLQEGLNQAETELIHQEVKPHDPRKEGALVDAIVAFVGEKEGATLVEPVVVDPVPPPALASFEPDDQAYGDFRGALEPFGDWFETPDYGPIWQPDDSYVDVGWQPYTNGSWGYSDYGWTWDSDDPFGWACDHYGRWLNVSHRGWCWVPGREWAPAWVSWRSNGRHIGWAALPPCATFNRKIGFGGWVDAHCGIGPGHYNFVLHSDLGARNCRQVIVSRSQNVRLVAGSKNLTHLHFDRGCVRNHGPDFEIANRRSSHPIHRSKVDLAEEKHAVERRIASARGREGSVKQIAVAGVQRGWEEVKAADERVRLRRQMLAEARGALGAGGKKVQVGAGGRQPQFVSSGGLPRPVPAPVKILQQRGNGNAKSAVAVSEVVAEAEPSMGSDHLDAEQARLDAALAQQKDYQEQRQKMIDDRLAKEAEARARLEAHIKVRQDRIAKADRELAAQKEASASRRGSSSVAAHQPASNGGSSAAPSQSNRSAGGSSSSGSGGGQSSSVFSRTKQHQEAVNRAPQKQAQAQPKPAAQPAAAPARAKQPSGGTRGTPQKRGKGK